MLRAALELAVESRKISTSVSEGESSLDEGSGYLAAFNRKLKCCSEHGVLITVIGHGCIKGCFLFAGGAALAVASV
jgi:hypothetical protein